MFDLIDAIEGNGQDGIGSIGGTDSPIDSAVTGTLGTKNMVGTNAGFSPGQIVLIAQTKGATYGQLEINKIKTYSPGAVGLEHNLKYEYTAGAQMYVLKQYSQVNMSSDVTVKAYDTVTGTGGIFGFLCSGKWDRAYNILGAGKGFPGGAGGVNTTTGTSGYSENGVGGGSTTNNGMGGGGGDNLGGNGTGGNQSVYTADGSKAGLGAGGGGANVPMGTPAQDGGNGGPLIYICVREHSGSGTISTNGNPGVADTDASGGGAAGFFFGRCFTDSSWGSNLITALGGSVVSPGTSTGGNGGGAGNKTAGQSGSVGAGGIGSDGYIRIEQPSVSVTTNPAASLQNNVSWAGVCP